MTPQEAKRKGAATESMLVEELRSKYGLANVERRHLSGAYDKGDISGWAKSDGSKSVVCEVKSAAALNIQQWLRELAAEKSNAKADLGFVACRPKGKPAVSDWFILMPFPEFMELVREAGFLNEF